MPRTPIVLMFDLRVLNMFWYSANAFALHAIVQFFPDVGQSMHEIQSMHGGTELDPLKCGFGLESGTKPSGN